MTQTPFLLEQRRSAAGALPSTLVRKLSITKPNAIERDVKDRVKKIIAEVDPTAHVFMPVQRGFGAADLDFVVTVNGFALRIETKVDGKQPSPRQHITIASLVKAGAVVLVIDQHNLIDVALIVIALRGNAPELAHHLSADSREIFSENFRPKQVK